MKDALFEVALSSMVVFVLPISSWNSKNGCSEISSSTRIRFFSYNIYGIFRLLERRSPSISAQAIRLFQNRVSQSSTVVCQILLQAAKIQLCSTPNFLSKNQKYYIAHGLSWHIKLPCITISQSMTQKFR